MKFYIYSLSSLFLIYACSSCEPKISYSVGPDIIFCANDTLIIDLNSQVTVRNSWIIPNTWKVLNQGDLNISNGKIQAGMFRIGEHQIVSGFAGENGLAWDTLQLKVVESIQYGCDTTKATIPVLTSIDTTLVENPDTYELSILNKVYIISEEDFKILDGVLYYTVENTKNIRKDNFHLKKVLEAGSEMFVVKEGLLEGNYFKSWTNLSTNEERVLSVKPVELFPDN